MKKLLEGIKKDLWIVLLDIIAVNAAFFLALILRFYVNSTFRPTVSYLLGDWARFTPFYTILALIIFMAWKLYGGMWRYAGINDMNRIILANVCTAVVHVIGTIIANGRRMPISYYVIGAILQFVMVVLIRFSYRMLLVEKKKMAKGERIPAVVIGSGDLGRRVVKHLEDGGVYKVNAIIGADSGRTLDGIPIRSFDDLQKTIEAAQVVFIADQLLEAGKRTEIHEVAGDREIQDYTGAIVNTSGLVPLTELLRLMPDAVTLVIDGKEEAFGSGEKALESLTTRYEVKSISGARIELTKPTMAMPTYGTNSEDISFF